MSNFRKTAIYVELSCFTLYFCYYDLIVSSHPKLPVVAIIVAVQLKFQCGLCFCERWGDKDCVCVLSSLLLLALYIFLAWIVIDVTMMTMLMRIMMMKVAGKFDVCSQIIISHYRADFRPKDG